MKTSWFLVLVIAVLVATVIAAPEEEDPLAGAKPQYARLDGMKIHYLSLIHI